jgi:hypothetical protein
VPECPFSWRARFEREHRTRAGRRVAIDLLKVADVPTAFFCCGLRQDKPPCDPHMYEGDRDTRIPMAAFEACAKPVTDGKPLPAARYKWTLVGNDA